MEALTYLDPYCRSWVAPAGAIVDGASIPQFAWSIIGGPFEGKYRDASVIHDVACREKNAPWEYIHLVFYYAMLANGSDPLKAKIMYAAVYHFGSRWNPPNHPSLPCSHCDDGQKEIKGKEPPKPNSGPPRTLRIEDFDRLKKAVESRERSSIGPMRWRRFKVSDLK